MTEPHFEFRINVIAESPEIESNVVKAIASEFIRLGIGSVAVIADNEHNNYIDGEVFNVTDQMAALFQGASEENTFGAYVVGQRPPPHYN